MKKLLIYKQTADLLMETKWNFIYENEECFIIVNKVSGVTKIKPKLYKKIGEAYEN